jgi:flagellin
MAITVKTNTAVGSVLTDLNKTGRSLSRSFERISSGLRIARAADDAAGLGVAENLRAAHTSATVAARNVNDGMSVLSVAEGAASEVSNILVRLRELAVQASSETLGASERSYADEEHDALVAEIGRISAVTEYNGIGLAGTSTGIDVQVGIDDSANNRITITTGNLGAAALGINALDLSSATGAQASLSLIDVAIASVSSIRADYGVTENRLNSALNNLETFIETTSAAESVIRDADFGTETAELTQNQILQQAGVSVLQQAKTINQAAISLLG